MQNSFKVNIITSNLQMQNMSLTEVIKLIQGQTTSKWKTYFKSWSLKLQNGGLFSLSRVCTASERCIFFFFFSHPTSQTERDAFYGEKLCRLLVRLDTRWHTCSVPRLLWMLLLMVFLDNPKASASVKWNFKKRNRVLFILKKDERRSLALLAPSNLCFENWRRVSVLLDN